MNTEISLEDKTYEPETAAAIKAMRAASDDWFYEAEERKEFHKAMFVTAMLDAMQTKGVKQSELAKKWKKSRQYLSRLLKLDRRVNFTIDTMIDLTILLELDFPRVLGGVSRTPVFKLSNYDTKEGFGNTQIAILNGPTQSCPAPSVVQTDAVAV